MIFYRLFFQLNCKHLLRDQRPPLLLTVLTDPDRLLTLSLRKWDRLLPLARYAGVLGRFYPQLAEYGMLDSIPAPVLPHLEAASIIAQEHERKIRWEVNRIQRALIDLTVPVVLLKGAAYVMAGLPCAQGRLVSDVDIMVPKAQLGLVEQALQRHGWEATPLDNYDQQYYRRWMHELPPLRHRLRGTLLDLHHTILPETSRLKPDPAKLLTNAQPVAGTRFQVLAPADMVLHSAAHAFHDGDLSNSLRDLLDLHDLLCHFGKDPPFWDELPHRAYELDLARPLFYAVRYTQRFLGTPLPVSLAAFLRKAAPPWPVCKLMDALISRTLLPPVQPPRLGSGFARWLLYMRSHWLRMPPLLLASHLLRKAHKRLQARLTQANQTGG
jgi:hypothetical protein